MTSRSTARRALGAICLVLAGLAGLATIAGVAGSRGAAQAEQQLPPAPKGPFDAASAMADLKRMVRFGPRPAGSPANRRQARWLARKLRAAGLVGVHIQRPHRNVVGRIRGTERGAIVIGTHHDTWAGHPRFVGANDGASGAAVVLGLARSLPRTVDGPSLYLAFFDAEEARPGRAFEEDGTRGSRQFVRLAGRPRAHRQGAPLLSRIDAAVIADMVGDCDLEIPREAGSDPRLYAAIRRAAGRGSPFSGREAGEILDDHTPFARRQIAAVDLIDIRYPAWHTPKDRLDRVCKRSLGWVGDALHAALKAGLRDALR